MQSRRRFFSIAASSAALLGARQLLTPAGSVAEEQPATPTVSDMSESVWVPLTMSSPPFEVPTATPEEPTPEQPPSPNPSPIPEPTPQPTPEPWPEPLPAGDGPLVGYPTGTVNQAFQWLVSMPNRPYTAYDLSSIVIAYQRIGDAAGMDWFLAIAQACHETDHFRSWWCQRPHRNPAGIGVTGRTSATQPTSSAWAWNENTGLWHEGMSFAQWDEDAVVAHLGRLLAYVYADPQNNIQQQLISRALAFRGLPASYRGCAQTIVGLNGKWAVPGTTYGQSILALRDQMRQMPA